MVQNERNKKPPAVAEEGTRFRCIKNYPQRNYFPWDSYKGHADPYKGYAPANSFTQGTIYTVVRKPTGLLSLEARDGHCIYIPDQELGKRKFGMARFSEVFKKESN